MLVGDRAHDGTHRQAVEVVVDENQAAQQHGRQLCPLAALNAFGSPCPESSRATRTVHQLHHRAQDNQEDEYANVPLVGQHGHDAVGEKPVESTYGVEVSIEQGPRQHSEEKRAVHLFSNQRQRDGDDGWCQRPYRILHRHVIDAYGINQPSQKQHHGYQRQICQPLGLPRSYRF